MTKHFVLPPRLLPAIAACTLLLISLSGVDVRAAEQLRTAEQLRQSSAILQELRQLRETGSVLYVAAHPDDENTHLITYLARGRGYRTAYLSLTRGDGGQNVIGGEFGSGLGAIRTQELLAARRLDGARQFFTRALDFGYSKNHRETLRIWDHQQVLGDVVRVIRMFRPDVIITRFSPEASGTHGHHTASAVLAVEAFKLAGDPKAFPDQLRQLKPWQPKRILQNGRGAGTLQINIGGTDPVLNESFAKIAGRSRAMHISQGFANYSGGAESRAETFQLLAGEPATGDILQGVDTTWNRYPGGAEIERRLGQVIENFNPNNSTAILPDLLQLRTHLGSLPADVVVEEKRHDLDRIVQACVGLTFETTVPRAEVVQGEQLQLRHRATVQSDVPIRWVAVKYPTANARVATGVTLKRGQVATRQSLQSLPLGTPISQPYWLRHEPTAGMARVDNAELIGLPENPAAFGITHVFEIGGQTLELSTEPVQVLSDAENSITKRRLEIIPPVSLHLDREVRLFAPGASRSIEVEVRAARPRTFGSLKLDVPIGWKVEPSTHAFRLTAIGDRVKISFKVTAPVLAKTAVAAPAGIMARATVNGASVDTQRVEIKYPHIPPLLMQPPAHLKAVVLDLAIRGKDVAYLPGAGDNVAQALEEMGYTVTQLSGADLTAERLRHFDAVVVGVRAFNVRTDLAETLPALFAYVENGGNVVMQYNRPENLKADFLAPFALTLSGQRVTNENAPVTVLAPEHPALNVPNKITGADFERWVQERGVYFPTQWDERFTPLLASGDPGEDPLKGGLLVARLGRGYFVYTGLAFFRQLPAGVPGAYRLFANLVALGK